MAEKIIKLPRMRTLDECYREIRCLDSKSAVSKYFIRQLALSGAIPSVMAGKKRLINLDKLIEYLANSTETQEDITAVVVNNKIKRIEV